MSTATIAITTHPTGWMFTSQPQPSGSALYIQPSNTLCVSQQTHVLHLSVDNNVLLLLVIAKSLIL
eukprot:1935218-Pyramimonas_sp.AAC.1